MQNPRRQAHEVSSTPSDPGLFSRARRKVVGLFSVSVLSVGFILAGLTASIAVLGVVGASPANAHPTDGWYTTPTFGGATISGFCVDADRQVPGGATYREIGGRNATGASNTLAWFATHFGPGINGVHDTTSGGGYPGGAGEPVLSGVPSQGDANSVTQQIGAAVNYVEDGRQNGHRVGLNDFGFAIAQFARQNPGPWSLRIQLNNSTGIFSPGTTYTGYVTVGNAAGGRVPVAGIGVQQTAQTNVSVNLGSGQTDPTGRLDFSFTVNALGPFDARLFSDDLAGDARIAENADNPQLGQRLLIPTRGSDSAVLFGLPPNTLPTGAIVLGKVDENIFTDGPNGFRGVGGATFFISNSNAVLVDVITTSNGSGVPSDVDGAGPIQGNSNRAPAGVAISNASAPLPPGTYFVCENPATPGLPPPPAGFFPPRPSDYDANYNGPFDACKTAQVVAGQFTFLVGDGGFANRYREGSLAIGKIDADLSPITGQAGATFEVARCRTLNPDECGVAPGQNPNETINLTTTAGGTVTQGNLHVGVYRIREIAPPPGFAPSLGYQLVIVGPLMTSPALFVNVRQPTVTTQVSSQVVEVGATVTDSIVVDNTGCEEGTAPCEIFPAIPILGLPAQYYSTAVLYVLTGPVPAAGTPQAPTCAGVVFPIPTTLDDPLVADSGGVPVNGDGTYTTPGFTVPAGGQGCYTYTELLVADNYVDNNGADTGIPAVGAAGPSLPGRVTETFLVPGVAPTAVVTTQISDQTSDVGDTITDAITVTVPPAGPQYSGNVAWTLLGPVAPGGTPEAPTCVGVTWTGAATAASGTVAVTTVAGTGTATTSGYTVPSAGCYTYVEQLAGDANYPAATTPSAPGLVTETTLVPPPVGPPPPEVTTQISTQNANVGAVIFDTIVVTGLAPGNATTATSTLLGPVPAAGTVQAPTCVGVDYTTAPTAGSWTVAVTGSGSFVTPSFTVTAPGCYTYVETLAATATTPAVPLSPPGRVSETVLVALPPTAVVSTQISDQTSAVGDTITDAITVTVPVGAPQYSGNVAWTLLGPVTPAGTEEAPTCVGVTWAGAATAASGTVTVTTVNGTGSATTAGHTVTTAGCYTYVEQLAGDATYPAATTPSQPGLVTETTLVPPPVGPPPPEVTTQISTQNANVGAVIFDTIVVSGLAPGTVTTATSTLLGPVPPAGTAQAPTCMRVDYTNAPTAGSWTVNVTGSGSFVTPSFTVTAPGCYTYVESLAPTETTPGVPLSPPGRVSETVLVAPLPDTPQVTTQISSQDANVGDTIFDTIVVSGLPAGVQTTAISRLVGPVPALLDGQGRATCVGVVYAPNAPTAGSWTVAVTGNGSFVTPSFTVTVAGCYTYVESLASTETTSEVPESPPGRVSETVVVTNQPQVSTEISKQRANVGDTITDRIKVTGSVGYQGPVNWVLSGPVTPVRAADGNLTCVGVSWTNAPIAAKGSVTVAGDGTYTTSGFKVLIAGCYTYTETLVGNSTTSQAGPSVAGQVSETVLVMPVVLAVTGTDVGLMALGGLALMLVGGAAALVTRRRGTSVIE